MQTSPLRRPSPRRRVVARRVAAAVLALGTTGLAGCGFDVQTNEIYQPAVGTNVRSGTVDVLAAVIVSPKTGSGVFLATLVDNSDTTGDQLRGVTAAGGVEVDAGSTLPKLPVQTPVDLADSGGIPVTGSAVNPVTSNYVELTLTFAKSDPVTINVPVVNDDGPYAGYGTAPSTPNSVASAGVTGAGQ